METNENLCKKKRRRRRRPILSVLRASETVTSPEPLADATRWHVIDAVRVVTAEQFQAPKIAVSRLSTKYLGGRLDVEGDPQKWSSTEPVI